MPWDRRRYPADWKAIVARVAERSRGQCECQGECGRHTAPCAAVHGEPHPLTGSRVVLTTAHLDHDTTNNDMSNLRHFCQRCHLAYDAWLHAAHARQTRVRRREEGGQQRLPGGDS